jgi:hypothetical protein
MASKKVMTARRWLECTEPQVMLEVLQERFSGVSPRKLRLFACACCRRIEHLMYSEAVRDALDAAERFADGLVSEAELQQRREAAHQIESPHLLNQVRRSVGYAGIPSAWEAVKWCPREVCEARAVATRSTYSTRSVYLSEWEEQAALLRDIIGNPFAPAVVVDPAWLVWNGGTVRQLAEAIYEEQRWDETTVLGDALEEAGCHTASILDHCHQSGHHARGCWVVDLLLDRR